MAERTDGDGGSEDRARRDAEGRRDHGRHRRRPGAHRRGRGRGGGDGPRARARPTSAGRAAWRAWPTPRSSRRSWPRCRIPVMAKCRIGHFAEARVLEALGVDFIDESEVLTPADEAHHVDKHAFTVPFVCGCRDLGEALRRIGEGAALDAHQGRGGHRQHRRGGAPHARGDVRHPPPRARSGPEELMARGQGAGRALRARARAWPPTGRLPVPNFAAGGIATPADAALMMALGAEAVFVGSGHLQVRRSRRARARAIVRATTHYAGREGGGRGLARAGRGHARPRRGRASAARGAAAGARLVTARSASSPCRATSPPTRARCARWAPRCARCGAAPTSTGLAGAGPPGRREHGAART